MAHFPHFWGKNFFFSKHPALSHTTPHGPLRPSNTLWVSEKTNEQITRKLPGRRMEGQTLIHRTLPAMDRDPIKLTVCWLYYSPQNSTQQSAIDKGFAVANSVFIVITLAKIFPRWLFPPKIYTQFTIFNTYFLTKLSFTNKRYHLHVPEKCLYILQEVKSIIYFRQFIHPLFLCSHSNGTNFAFTSNIIVSTKFCDITFLNNFYCFILLPFVHLPAPKENKICDIKQKLFI